MQLVRRGTCKSQGINKVVRIPPSGSHELLGISAPKCWINCQAALPCSSYGDMTDLGPKLFFLGVNLAYFDFGSKYFL